MKTTAGKNLMSPQEYFSELQQPQTPRSSFDRGCEIMTTLDAGNLVPLYWDEVLPADTWNVSQNLFARINTLIKPLMDNLYLDIHWFFVPNRLVWDHWVNLMGEQVDPAAPIVYTTPQVTIGATQVLHQSLGDYLGLPTLVSNLSVSALPIRSYYKIYDDYYRDENLIAEQLPVAKRGDAAVVYSPANFPLLKRAKRKDYFTSALPWAQKGTAPTLTLGTTAPVKTNNVDIQWNISGTDRTARAISESAGTFQNVIGYTGAAAATNLKFGTNTGLVADLASSVGFTLNAFREFATLQQYLELDARGGTRYVEHLYSFFGVQPEDARLQRAEYLGGQSFDLTVTPIAQTAPQSATGTTTPQANLSGMGTFAASGHQFVKSFTEDGIVMAIGSIRQEQRYQYGLQKKWTRTTKYDYYRPVFANLGEQPILNEELYAQGTAADKQTYGYQEAWAEYRYSQSLITGKLRSNDPLSLDVWHLAQDFGSLPTLGKAFIEENPPMARVIAVTTEPAFTLNGRFNLNVARAMPTRSIPGLTRL